MLTHTRAMHAHVYTHTNKILICCCFSILFFFFFLSFCFCKKLCIIPKQPSSVRANKAVSSNESKSNLLLSSLYYSEASYKFAGPISASLHLGYTAPFEEILQLWRAVSNTMFDLTGSRFEPQTSRSREKRVTARPTGRF